jgi:hypothetical protein
MISEGLQAVSARIIGEMRHCVESLGTFELENFINNIDIAGFVYCTVLTRTIRSRPLPWWKI